MEFLRENALRLNLSTVRRALLPIGFFSMVFNVLVLAMPLYMMQVYDRVLISGSRETLLFRTIGIIGVILVTGLLDTIRSEIVVRVSGWLEHHIAPKAFAQAIEAALQQRALTTQALRDLSTVRRFLGGAPCSSCATLCGRRSIWP